MQSHIHRLSGQQQQPTQHPIQHRKALPPNANYGVAKSLAPPALGRVSVNTSARTVNSEVQSHPFPTPIVNLGPHQERQRVRRACENCRKRKIKCNGAEPCQKCINSETVCEYADYVPPAKVDASNVEKLESRVGSIETLLRQLLNRLDSSASGTSNLGAGDIAEVVPAADSNGRGATTETLQSSSSKADLRQANQAETEYVDNDVNYYYDNQTIEEEEEEEVAGQAPEEEMYADGFGELDVDPNGQLRYVGLGSTALIVDTCVGLRRHITQGLERKGYEGSGAYFHSPGATGSLPSSFQMPRSVTDEMPSPSLVDLLLDLYFKERSFLFPIILESDVRAGYRHLTQDDTVDAGYAAILFAILAVAALHVPKQSSDPNKLDPRDLREGTSFYNLAVSFANVSCSGDKAERKGKSQDIVVALGILSLYLAETGSQAEAWIMVGRAIRLGQDLGLHRSPERLHLPWEERSKRRYLWWCLYILERQLSIALGRPLSIDDLDCDVEVPSESSDGQHYKETEGFVSMILLHKVLGVILKTVNSVKNADAWQDVGKYEELRKRVRGSNLALQTWAKEQVPLNIKHAQSGTLLAQKHIALSSFFSGVILLHRVYMSNPHRPSPLEDSQAKTRSGKAATDCIRATPAFLENVPKCHYLVLHGQHVFVSAIVLLQCVRSSDDRTSIDTMLKDVELALDLLRRLEEAWAGARKCRGIVEEYLEFTLHVLETDRKGVCCFSHSSEHNHTTESNGRKAIVKFGATQATASRPGIAGVIPRAQTVPSSYNAHAETRPPKRQKLHHAPSSTLSCVSTGDQVPMQAQSTHGQAAASTVPLSQPTGCVSKAGPTMVPSATQANLEAPPPNNMQTGTHFDDVIGNFLDFIPSQSAFSPPQDTFFSGFDMNMDFNTDELSMLCPELWPSGDLTMS